MSYTFKLRRDIAVDWTTKNPILSAGEPGIETDTNRFKLGNGVAAWAELPYFLDTAGVTALVESLLTEGGGAGPHTHPETDITNLVADLAAKAAASALSSHTANVSNPHSVTKAQIGLGSVDNTSDAAKPISTATQTALDAKASVTSLASHVADVANPHSVTKSQVGLGNVDNTSDVAKPVSTATQTALDAKASITSLASHIADVANPHSVTKTQVGLGNVDNTSDTAKPISTATQTALDAKAPTASPTFTGTVAAANVTLSGRLRMDYDTLSDANPIVVDSTLGNRFSLTLTANAHVLGNPSSPVNGQAYFLQIKQDATGGWAMTLGSKFNDPNGYYTGVATAPNARSYLGYVYDSSDDQFDVLAFAAGY